MFLHGTGIRRTALSGRRRFGQNYSKDLVSVPAVHGKEKGGADLFKLFSQNLFVRISKH